MWKNVLVFFLVLAFLGSGAMVASTAKADDYAYFMDMGYAGLLGKIDLTTGACSKIGYFNPSSINSESWIGLGAANGKLYSVSNSNNNYGQLWSINTGTGAATAVGKSGLWYAAFGSTASGLYAIGAPLDHMNQNNLYSIDPNTGAATYKGDALVNPWYAGAHDLSTGSASLYNAYGTNSYQLYSINTETGTETSIGSYVSGVTARTYGVTEVNGTLYGTGFAGYSYTSSLIRTINPVTGAFTNTVNQYYSNGDPAYGISSLAPNPFSVTPNPFDFGSVNIGASSPPQTFTISNTGAADLIVASATVSGGNFSVGTGTCGTLPATIAPGGSCTVTATFTPASAGTLGANLVIVSNDPATPAADIPLSGTGVILSYTLTYTAGANGTISGSTPQTVNSGGSGTQVTAVANPGYHFVSWDDGVTTAARTDTNVTANINVTASFALQNQYTLNFTAGAGGAISGTTPQYVLQGGSSKSVTAVPDTGYHFVNWTGDNGFVKTKTKQLTVHHVKANHNITANFVINQYTITFAAGHHGSVTGTKKQTVSYGGNTTPVTATAATGYHFLNWTGTKGFVTTSDNPLTVNVTASQTITANFAPNQFALNFDAGAGGTVTGTTPQTINYGGSATKVSANPDIGYHFVNWTGDNGFATTKTNPLTVKNVKANQNITANFAINQYTLTFTAGPHGSISGTKKQTVNYGGSATSVTATPASGYHFVKWIGTHGFVTTTDNPLTMTNVAVSQKITANFSK